MIKSGNPLKNHIFLEPFNLNSFFNYCFKKEIQSIIVEGGRKTLQNFIDKGYWDEARVFTSNKKLNKDILITTNYLFNASVRKLKTTYNIKNIMKCERTWLQHVNRLHKTIKKN